MMVFTGGTGKVPFFCFSRISAATASLSRCISLPLLELPFFCTQGGADQRGSVFEEARRRGGAEPRVQGGANKTKSVGERSRLTWSACFFRFLARASSRWFPRAMACWWVWTGGGRTPGWSGSREKRGARSTESAVRWRWWRWPWAWLVARGSWLVARDLWLVACGGGRC